MIGFQYGTDAGSIYLPYKLGVLVNSAQIFLTVTSSQASFRNDGPLDATIYYTVLARDIGG
jgi:hypothetical protein